MSIFYLMCDVSTNLQISKASVSGLDPEAVH